MQTYSYTASAARNFTPLKPTIKPGIVKLSTGIQERQVDIPRFASEDVPKRSFNRQALPCDTRDGLSMGFDHSFQPTVSGTGGGRQYWSYTKNPYSD